MLKKDTLAWEITSKERRNQVQSAVLKIGILLVALTLITPFYDRNTRLEIKYFGLEHALNNIAYSVLGIIIILSVFFLINKFFRHSNRNYVLDDVGVRVFIDGKGKQFQWQDFEYFYGYSLRGLGTIKQPLFSEHSLSSPQGIKEQLYQAEKEIEGGIFYLKKRPKGNIAKIYKVFAVVRAEPENTIEVFNFLRRHLPEKQMTGTSDLGLVFYEFK